MVLRFYEHSLARRTRAACAFHAVCFGNYTFFQRQGRLPPAATKPVRSSSSFTVESLLRSAAVKPLAPGNKPDTGEDGCHFEGCNSSASSQCWPPYAPQGLLLPGTAILPCGGSLSTGRIRLVFRTRRRLGHRGLRFRRAGQRLQSQHRCLRWCGSMSHLGTAVSVEQVSGIRVMIGRSRLLLPSPFKVINVLHK